MYVHGRPLQGRAFEFNNRRFHAVESHWDEYRVHLIFDVVDEDDSEVGGWLVLLGSERSLLL